MGSSRLVALVVVVGLTGCKGVGGVKVDHRHPLELTVAEAQRVRAEAWRKKDPVVLDQVARVLREDYDAQWQAAQAWATPAETAPTVAERIRAAKAGIVVSRHGRELAPDRVEAHYWYAINVGLLAEADRSYGLNAVGEIEAALKRAGELDETYDRAGPLRVLGILHLRTPPPPVSIGSARRGLRLLERARAWFPDDPENLLYLAEALRENGRREEACAIVEQLRRLGSAAGENLLPCPPEH
jgi:hypothetical protein